MPKPVNTLQLGEIRIYPVKSLGGIRCDRWPVDARGLRYDRHWMVVDTDGRFLTQRQVPEMALIKTALPGQHLELTAPGMEPLQIPLDLPDGAAIPVTVWRDRVLACRVGEDADRWLSDCLGRSCHLVFLPERSRRGVDPAYGREGDEIAFSDGFPFLVISEGSLAALNDRMGLRLTMARFRPNLVILGCEGYAEDTWRRIRIGTIEFRLPKPCARCTIPTIDPDSAQKGREPLETLNRTRHWNDQVYFGQNALHDNTGTLRVGDAVSVLLAGPAQPPLHRSA